MSDRASALLTSLMASVDDFKGKISEGEYLNVCNLLKSLNDEIKNISNEESEEESEDEEEESEEERYRPSYDINLSIEERINHFFNEPYEGQDIENRNISASETRFLLDHFLIETIEKENQREDAPWFMCLCGCSVHSSNIGEHIKTRQHKNNIRPYFS
jgi:hypothetical protein